MSVIKERIDQVKEKMELAATQAGRSPNEVTLIGVTKTVAPQVINTAIAAGLEHIGENRVQEARKKAPQITSPVTWHLIGHLQRNKVKHALELFQMIQSVDSLSLATELNRRALSMNRKIEIMVEVNIGNEASKFGILPEEVPSFLHQISTMEALSVCGLMTIPPFSRDPEDSRPYFRQMNSLFQKLKKDFPTLNHLSMGMSGDYPVAIQEGATIIRVGTAIFGARD